MKLLIIVMSLICMSLSNVSPSHAIAYDFKVSGVITSVSDPWGHLYGSTDDIEVQAKNMSMLNALFSFDTNNVVDSQYNNLFYAYNVSVEGFYSDYRGICSGFVQLYCNLLAEVLLIDDVYDHVIRIDLSDMTWHFSDVFSSPYIWDIGGEITNFEQVNPVPEPSSIVLLGVGLAALVLRRRRKMGATYCSFWRS